MRGKNRICKITDRKIKEVKKLLERFSPLPPKHSERPLTALSLRDISRTTGISFYTVWCIKQGKYDTNEPLKAKVIKGRFFNVDEYWHWQIGGSVVTTKGGCRL